MRLVRHTQFTRILVAGALMLPATTLRGQSQPVMATEPRPQTESFLQPVVCDFDFEQADAPPNALPMHFVRNIAPAQGFPNFGGMRLSTSCAYSGERSFEFQLSGGSMSASVPTSVIPILPFADYLVTVQVRTLNLHHAGARLVAWLHDVNGKPIHESRAQSEVARTAGAWQPLTVEIHGEYANAADLVFELQLVQPSHFSDPAMTHGDQPRDQDISGFAWFDDIRVVHLPRVILSMDAPGNLVTGSSAPQLQVLVSELTSKPLMSRLRVFDVDGASVFDSSFPAPRGTQAGTLRLPRLSCGWYRAVLEIENERGGGRSQHLDFIILPEASRRIIGSAGGCRFGVVLDNVPGDNIEALASQVGSVHASLAVIPVWQADNRAKRQQMRQDAVRTLIDQLLRRSVDLAFSIDTVPQQLATLTGVETDQPFKLMLTDPASWEPELHDLLVNFGLEVRRWQIGSPNAKLLPELNEVPRAIEAASNTLVDFVPDPQLYARWPIEQPMPDVPAHASFTLDIPHHVSPAGLETYAQALGDRRGSMIAHLELLDRQRFTPRQRLADALQRGLHGWRAGFAMLTIQAPWIVASSQSSKVPGTIMPDPVFSAWRALSEHLNGCEFVGELPLPPGCHCWIVREQGSNHATLIAWSDFNGAHAGAMLRTQLADGPVEVTDVFGNMHNVEMADRMHSVPLTDTPVFIENINLDLVQFRGAFAIEPPFIRPVTKVHEHEIVLQNPWDVPVSGSIRLSCDETLTLQPTVHEFSIAAQSEVRLPLQIIPGRSIVAGARTIDAEISLHADHLYALHLQTTLEIGLKDIDLAASWSISRNPITGRDDVVITEAVTNKSEDRINLDVYLLAQGVGQNRRTIAGLGPGETAIRTFRIDDGLAKLAGQQIRVGVAERDGLTRLNQVLTITPESPGSRRADAPFEQ